MPLTGKETHRRGDRVHIEFSDARGVIFDQWNDAAAWDADQKRVIAMAADQLAKQTPGVADSASVIKAAVTATDAEIAAKLAQIDLEKKAALAAAEVTK